jgi:type 1 glutamine amidotransferase
MVPAKVCAMLRSTFLRLMLSSIAVSPTALRAAACNSAPRKLVLIAGKPSHPPMMHEFRAGTILLEKRLQQVANLKVERHEMGWVKDEATFDDAAAVVIFSDGGGGHPAIQENRLQLFEKLIARGVGFGCMHFGVEVPKDRGGAEFQRWIGGHYEHQWSCNPIWDATFESFPEHPISRGVKPFEIRDEWYFNMRFAEGFDTALPTTVNNVQFTPVLAAVPSTATRNGPYVYPPGPYPHIQQNAGRKETLLWAIERPDGGKGFGFTGGHFHTNWQNEDFRRTILNALCWITGIEVPTHGVDSAAVSDTEIRENLDPKGKR